PILHLVEVRLGGQPLARAVALRLAVAAAAALVDAGLPVGVEPLRVLPEHDRPPDLERLTGDDDRAAHAGRLLGGGAARRAERAEEQRRREAGAQDTASGTDDHRGERML